MANLTESPIYEPGIFQLEKLTPPLGGAPVIDNGVPSAGHANAQGLQLANRTAWLKDQVTSLQSQATFDPAAGKVPRARDTGYVDYTWLSPINNQRPEVILYKATLVPDAVYFRQFGAIGDGTSHPLSERFSTLTAAQAVYPHATSLSDETDWAAIQLACNSNSKVLWGGSGVFISNKKILIKNKDKSIFGDGESVCEIRFTAQVDFGVRFEQNGPFASNFAGIFVSTNLLNTGTGLSASYVGYTGIYDRNKRFLNFSKNRVSGTDYFQFGWVIGVLTDEVTLPIFSENFVVGRRNTAATSKTAAMWWPWTQYGYYYTSSTNLEPTDAIYESCDCRYAATAYYNKGTLEGVRYIKCLAVACEWGIDDDRRAVSGDSTINPWLGVTECHLNCAAGAIRSRYAYQGFISDNLIYQFDQVDEAFLGITLETGNNWKVHSNHITMVATSAFSTAGIRLQQNNKSFVHDNDMEFGDFGVVISGTNGIVGTRVYNNRATGRDGKEILQVTYINGADKYLNPSAILGGIVSENANSATVAIASGGVNTISTFSLDDYPAGSIFKIYSICQVTKGGTAGTTKLYVEKTAGTANVLYMFNSTGLGVQNDSHVAGTNWQANLAGIIKKTSAGTLSLKLAVSSGGSNASVAAGDGQYVLERIL